MCATLVCLFVVLCVVVDAGWCVRVWCFGYCVWRVVFVVLSFVCGVICVVVLNVCGMLFGVEFCVCMFVCLC